MKNLPEEEMNELRKRLADYTEEPDEDTWDAIATQLPRRTYQWVKPTVLALLFVSYGFLMWMGGRYSASREHDNLLRSKGISENSKDETLSTASCEIACVDGTFQASDLPAIASYQEGASASSLSRKVTSGTTPPTLLPITSLTENDNNISLKEYPFSSDAIKISNNYPPAALTMDSAAHVIDSTEHLAKTDTIAPKKKNKKVPTTRFSWYAMVTPSLAYQKIIPFKTDEVFITKIDPKGTFATDRLGVGAELGFQMELTNKVVLYSGLVYYQQNSTINYSYQSDKVHDITSAQDQFSYTLYPVSVSESVSYKMKNVGLSVGALYHLQGDRLRHSLGLGVQYQFGMLKQNGNEGYTNKGSSSLHYQVLYRIEWAMNQKYHWFVQPNYTRVLLSKEHMLVPLKVDPYKAGIGVGLIYYIH